MRSPDHNDANLILKLYELRREPVMRQARNTFWDLQFKTLDDVKKVLAPEHPNNPYFRQVTSYWEMAANFVNRNILHAELFADNCGEGLYVLAKLEPFITKLRESYSPTFLVQLEMVVAKNPAVRERYGRIQEKVKAK